MPPAVSAATAVYTVVPAAEPSLILPAAPELIVGATSVTETVTAWVRDLMSGNHPTFSPGDFTIVEDTGSGEIGQMWVSRREPSTPSHQKR